MKRHYAEVSHASLMKELRRGGGNLTRTKTHTHTHKPSSSISLPGLFFGILQLRCIVMMMHSYIPGQGSSISVNYPWPTFPTRECCRQGVWLELTDNRMHCILMADLQPKFKMYETMYYLVKIWLGKICREICIHGRSEMLLYLQRGIMILWSHWVRGILGRLSALEQGSPGFKSLLSQNGQGGLWQVFHSSQYSCGDTSEMILKWNCECRRHEWGGGMNGKWRTSIESVG